LLGLLLIYLIGFSIAVAPLRFAVKRLTGKHWACWYVRRATDAALIGLFLLLCYAAFPSEHEDELASATHLTSSKVFYEINYPEVPKPFLMPLLWLESADIFLGHFFQFVILPSFIVGFAGYTNERKKANPKKIEGAG
jgi:hypothetical protein